MRATINFDIDVDKVQETMKALAKAQSDNIRSAAHTLATGEANEVEKCLQTSLRMLRESVQQLEQYESMLASFAKARYETMLPQAVPEVMPNVVRSPQELAASLEKVNRFGDFIDRLNSEADSQEDEDVQATEG